MRKALAIAVIGAAALPANALAHASLEQTWPKFRQRVQVAPRVITLAFDQGVTALPNAVEVVTASGRRVSGTARRALIRYVRHQRSVWTRRASQRRRA